MEGNYYNSYKLLDISSRICLTLPMVHLALLGPFCLGPGLCQPSLAWQGTSHQLLQGPFLISPRQLSWALGWEQKHWGPSLQRHRHGHSADTL